MAPGFKDSKDGIDDLNIDIVSVGNDVHTFILRCRPEDAEKAIAFGKAFRDRLVTKGAKLAGGVVITKRGSFDIPD